VHTLYTCIIRYADSKYSLFAYKSLFWQEHLLILQTTIAATTTISKVVWNHQCMSISRVILLGKQCHRLTFYLVHRRTRHHRHQNLILEAALVIETANQTPGLNLSIKKMWQFFTLNEEDKFITTMGRSKKVTVIGIKGCNNLLLFKKTEKN